MPNGLTGRGSGFWCWLRNRPGVGPGPPSTLQSRNSLAVTYVEAGRATEAIPLFEQTLAARERALGPDHPDTLTSRDNLAAAYQEAGRAD